MTRPCGACWTRAASAFPPTAEYDTNTTVIFTFEGVDYLRRDGAPLDLSQITYRRQAPFTYDNTAQTVSYVITVDRDKEYTISQDDFTWPGDQQSFHDSRYIGPWQCPLSWDWYSLRGTWTEDVHWLTWTNFHNDLPVRLKWVDRRVLRSILKIMLRDQM